MPDLVDKRLLIYGNVYSSIQEQYVATLLSYASYITTAIVCVIHGDTGVEGRPPDTGGGEQNNPPKIAWLALCMLCLFYLIFNFSIN